jgi:predicted  nucleic acid-binding Zn-ribbon protein|tara:strand:+ start:87 stop:473 length:387 start_codon:yes stop_codon:yes gene_type:complete
MLINTPISLGELVDKVSILMIKQKNISDQKKLNHVTKELDFLKKTLAQYVEQEEIQTYLDKLNDINSKLWKIEDDIRECEKDKKFDQTFIELARSVYFTNDQRANVKSDINNNFGSELVEVKSYEEYS